MQSTTEMFKTKKIFSIRKKLILIFGLLVTAAVVIQSFIAVKIAQNAITEKVETHLLDKADTTAALIDSKITAFLSFIEGIGRSTILQDSSLSYTEKAKMLNQEASFNTRIQVIYFCDRNGTAYFEDGTIISIGDREWFKKAIGGTPFVTEAYISRFNNKLVNTLAIPVYDIDRKIIGVLAANTDGIRLSKDIDDIIVGKTGHCYILGPTGTVIAHKNAELVEKQANLIELAKTDAAYADVAAFTKVIMENEKVIGYYTLNNVENIGASAIIKATGWRVIVRAPVNEFMNTIATLQRLMGIVGLALAAAAIVITSFIARKMVHSVQNAVNVLKDIAHGEGDLTVRLPITGRDEVTELSEYFNRTIKKIGLSIKNVDNNAAVMQKISRDLAENMNETASSINQINGTVESVKERALNQAASVTETAATIEQIIRSIRQLDSNIDAQAASVAQSSSSIEEMTANISSITHTLEKTDSAIKHLAEATDKGKTILVNSNNVTQKIAEESGSLMEASSVIQHIASQTNLLAMNAAIEAAHAGEAGKGFAVVADEIRKLAEESAGQGKTITATLKNLSGEIESLSTASKTVEDEFNVIFNLAKDVKDMSTTLTAAMREQENGSKEVLAAIKNINTVTTEVQEGSEQMLRGGEQVADEMHKLDKLTHSIADSMNEMALGAAQINNAVQEVHGITQKNKQSIENLAEEVGKFKI